MSLSKNIISTRKLTRYSISNTLKDKKKNLKLRRQQR